MLFYSLFMLCTHLLILTIYIFPVICHHSDPYEYLTAVFTPTFCDRTCFRSTEKNIILNRKFFTLPFGNFSFFIYLYFFNITKNCFLWWGGGREEVRKQGCIRIMFCCRIDCQVEGWGGGQGEQEYYSKFPFFPGEYRQSQWNVGTVENNTSERDTVETRMLNRR